jgi:CRP/FNR family transcriptional regulator, putaive post-exponential-phase nitrogen-starvation regulator
VPVNETTEGWVRRYGLAAILPPPLVAALRPVRRAPGELFIRADDPVTALLFLVKGRIKVYSTLENGHRVLAGMYRPFEVLGELELLVADRFTLTVEAITDAVCLALPVEALRAGSDRTTGLYMYLCARLGAKLKDRVIADSINLRYPVENRLASWLLASTDTEGWMLEAATLGEIADALGASYRQVARVVRAFRARGILAATRGRIRVRDRARLTPLARDLYARTRPRVAVPRIGGEARQAQGHGQWTKPGA